MRLALAALAAVTAFAWAFASGCDDRRRPIKTADGSGPAVVVVDPVKRPLQPVELVSEREPDDDTAHAQPMVADKGIRGTLGTPKDQDVFSFMAAGAAPDGGFSEVRIELSGVPGVDLVLEALDGDGKRLQLVNDAQAGEGETIANLAVEPGHSYYVRVRAQPPAPSDKPYELVLRSAAAPAEPGSEREPNDDAAHATSLPGLDDASGFYGRRRDEDWLKVPWQPPAGVAGGAALRVELQPVEGVVPSLRVMSGTTVVAEARGGRGDELRLRNVGIPAGTPSAPMLVALKAVEGRNPDVRWALRMQMEAPLEGAEREPNDTVAKATPVTVLGPTMVSGFLWPGDADVYRASAPAGGLVTVDLEAPDRVDVRLERLAEGGKSLAKADDAGPGKPERLPPWPSGDLVLRVTARARDSAFDAPYRLTITPGPPEADLEREPNGTPETATAWTDGAGSMRGYLAPKGDEDLFRFVQPAGKSRATADATAGATARITDESRLPLPPGGALTPGKSYLLRVKASSDKTSSPRDPYTVTLRLE